LRDGIPHIIDRIKDSEVFIGGTAVVALGQLAQQGERLLLGCMTNE
jgi:hypothetical protein